MNGPSASGEAIVGWISERPVASLRSRPRLAVCLAALVATSTATYPVLFLGRSLVSPNDGFVRLLYHEVPYAPGSSDRFVEEVRGNDVGATMVQGIPHSLVQREALTSGEIPLWNRYHSSGRPLWAQGLTFLLDPLHWLTLVVPDPAAGWDLKLVAHRFAFAAGVGVVSLAVTGALLPSVVVAMATPFIGLYAYRFNHPALFALTYSPLILLAWARLVEATARRPKVMAAMLLALSSALVLVASTPKEGVIVLGCAQIAGALAVLLSPGDWRQRSSRLFYSAVAGIACVMLTTPHWLPFLEALRQSSTAYDKAYVDLADRSFAVGFFLGPLTPGAVRPGLHLLALVTMCASLAVPRHLLQHRIVLASAVVAGALIALAFGAVPAPWLARVPFVGNVGHLHDVLLTAALPLLLLVSSSGFAIIMAATAWRGTAIAMLTAAACALLFVSVAKVSRDDGFEPWAILLMAPIAVALPTVVHAVRKFPRRALPVLSATAAVWALLLPGGLHTESGLIALDELLLQPRPRIDLLARSAAIEAIHADKGGPVRTVGLDWILHSGSQVFYGLEGIGGPDPLDVPAYRDLLDAAGIRRRMVWFTEIPFDDVARLSPLLDILNVGYLLARTDAVPRGFIDVPLPGPDRIRLGRRPSAWPRAFFVDGVLTHVDAPDLLRMAAAAGQPFAAIRLADVGAVEATRAMTAPSQQVIPARDYMLTTNSTSFRLTTPAPGVAVLNETYLPDDFRATLNGQPVRYFCVNEVFKAVVIPAAGRWDVRFEYRPRHWTESLAVAALGVALLVGLRLMSGKAMAWS